MVFEVFTDVKIQIMVLWVRLVGFCVFFLQ
jgi:hypothetical protein